MNRTRFFLVPSLLATALLSADLLTAAEPPGPEWRSVKVLAAPGFDDLTVRFENGEVRQAFLVGLRPIPPELGPIPPGKEQFQDQRRRIAQKVFEHLKSADLFAQTVTEQDGKLGLSIDAFAQHRHAFPHPWDPRKYPYCNTGWGAYNFNLFFLEQGYTTFLDNLGDHELKSIFQAARREIGNNLSKSVVAIHTTTPPQNVRILYYDDDLLFLARDPGDERTRPREKQPDEDDSLAALVERFVRFWAIGPNRAGGVHVARPQATDFHGAATGEALQAHQIGDDRREKLEGRVYDRIGDGSDGSCLTSAGAALVQSFNFS